MRITNLTENVYELPGMRLDSESFLDITTEQYIADDRLRHEVNGLSRNHKISVADAPDGFPVATAGEAEILSGEEWLGDTSGGSQPVVSSEVITVDAGPYALAFSPDGAKAYVTCGSSSPVNVIDVATGAVTNKISVGSNPQGIAFTPDGSKAYVANNADSPGTLAIIDTGTETVTGTVTGVGTGPITVSISPDGSKAYVVDGSAAPGGVAVTVVDVATDTVIASATDAVVGDGLLAGALRPGAAEFWVLGGATTVLNTGTLAAAATVADISNPLAIVFSPDGALAYIADENAIQVVAATTKTIIDTIAGSPVFAVQFGLAIKSDGSLLYSSGNVAGISVIDTATRAVIGTINSPDQGSHLMGVIGLAVNPAGTLLYAADGGQGIVVAADGVANTLGYDLTGAVSLMIGAYVVTFPGTP